MQTRTRVLRVAYRSAVLAIGLVTVAGCHGENSPGAADGHEEGHAHHEIPAHKPKTFPDAVRRLRELNGQILSNLAGGGTGTSPEDKSLQFALDTANWLPEIAADCDMPEEPWNKVTAQSATLVADYQAIASAGASGDPRQRVDDAGKAITELEALLAAADPKWFTGNDRAAAPP